MARPNPAIQALLQATRPDAIGTRYVERTRFTGQAVNRAAAPWRLARIVDGRNYGKGDQYVRGDDGNYGYWFVEIDRLILVEFVGSLTRNAAGVSDPQRGVPGMGQPAGFVPLPTDGTTLSEVLVTQPAGNVDFPLMRVFNEYVGDEKHITVCQDLHRIGHLKPSAEVYRYTVACDNWQISIDDDGHVRWVGWNDGSPHLGGPRAHDGVPD
jgi:hypothetical protein